MKIIAENKKGLFNFEILDKWQAGLKLKGFEVKSAKAGQIDLKGSYITVTPGQKKSPEAWLIGCHIARYKKAGYGADGYDPLRPRKLLLNKKELDSLVGKIKQKGLTILPIKVYTSHGLVKLEIGLGRGPEKYDKREAIKKREFELRKQKLVKN